jgi:thiamine biosynthesis protein ThiS
MRITLNGNFVDFDGPLTLSALLERHRLKPESVVVEHNLRVPPKEEYASTEIREGDRIEIVKFMGGG